MRIHYISQQLMFSEKWAHTHFLTWGLDSCPRREHTRRRQQQLLFAGCFLSTQHYCKHFMCTDTFPLPFIMQGRELHLQPYPLCYSTPQSFTPLWPHQSDLAQANAEPEQASVRPGMQFSRLLAFPHPVPQPGKYGESKKLCILDVASDFLFPTSLQIQK